MAGLLAGGLLLGGLFVLERRRPLRPPTRPAGPRRARNIAMGAACLAVINLTDRPMSRAITTRNAERGRGIAALLPEAAGQALGFLALDYSYYGWHVATHRLPWLWRLHRVHHVDPDLDMSTALRFHFADMVVTLPFRAAQLRLSGVSPATFAAWQVFFFASVLFHHSNLRLPAGWDRRLARLVTTPEMHGLHHSRNAHERDRNFSSGISLWDRLHGSFRHDVTPANVIIGVDDATAERDAALLPALMAPLGQGLSRGSRCA